MSGKIYESDCSVLQKGSMKFLEDIVVASPT